MNTLEVVVGAQFGSEAKGHVVQRLTERAQGRDMVPQVIRVAGPNAGHTGYDAQGQPWALRQVPVAAVTSGQVVLGIAAGSEIDPPVLLSELDALKHQGLLRNKTMWVSGEATVITDEDKHDESFASHHDLVAKIGSTGKGIGAARAGRLMRQSGRLVKDDRRLVNALDARGVLVSSQHHLPGVGIHIHTIIEGTQGFGLGLHAGYYPQCTSSDCRASDFMAMAGVHPWEFDKVAVWAVARMYPIRVAGNSGPLLNETTWEELGLPEERTTVTKKVRRVGRPDWELVERAVRANGGAPTVRLAVTMVDQMFPHMSDKKWYDPVTGPNAEQHYHEVRTYLKAVERETGARVRMITTGPNTASFIDEEEV